MKTSSLLVIQYVHEMQRALGIPVRVARLEDTEGNGFELRQDVVIDG